MKNTITYFKRSFQAELIKTKNTLGIWSILIFPSFVTFINFMIYYNRPEILINSKSNLWIQFTINSITIWSFLFLPLFIAIITFYINYSEHKSSGWKNLYALPVPKWSVYFTKLSLSILIVIFTMLFLYILNYLAMVLLGLTNPKILFYKHPFDQIIPITFLKVTIASFGIVSIQFMISLLFSNFIYSLGFGLLATLSTAMLISWEKIIYFPYSFSFLAAQDLRLGNVSFFTNQVIWGMIVCLICGFAGYFLHARRRVV